MIVKNDTKFKEQSTSHFKIDTRNLMNFDASTPNLKKFTH